METSRKIPKNGPNAEGPIGRRRRRRRRRRFWTGELSLEGESIEAAASSELSKEIHIPIWMVLVFLAGYTACGGILFRALEGWDYFEAFYFSFHFADDHRIRRDCRNLNFLIKIRKILIF